jgi:pimeloyl-ACP methyl ester carboxylesterase
MIAARLIFVSLAVAAMATFVAVSTAAATPRLSIAGTHEHVYLCAHQRFAYLASDGGTVVARVTPVGAHRGTLSVVRCQAGRWVDPTRYRVSRTGRVALRLATGDYRLRARVASAPGRAVYVRVGVGEIVDEPVSFAVHNVNRSQVPCPTDGREYQVAAHLVGPASGLHAAQRSLTIYVHGGFIGERLWRLPVPGYDHAYEMALLGHVSVTLDMLGMGHSGLPDGRLTCIGGDADVIHQVIGQLRAGSYNAGKSPSFQRIALAGLSAGSYRVLTEAASFGDVDALLPMGGLSFPSPTAFASAIAPAILTCAAGGEPKHGDDGPPGYVNVNLAKNQNFLVYNAEPNVRAAALNAAEYDPCGEVNTLVTSGVIDSQLQARITVPVLVVFGDHDAFFPPPYMGNQPSDYSHSPDATLLELKDTGHVVQYSRTTPTFRAKLSAWLSRREF